MSPRTWRKINFGQMVFYIILTPAAYYLGWLKSVTFVSFLSLWALVVSAQTAWRADVPDEPEDKEHGI